ncbi:16S rRNA (adenine(1518)-N(6)/adenine(1519)-N(6))-dimethyltransferase RsmA [Bacteroidota bacterium]
MPAQIRPKKSLGQHFLKDENIAQKIVDALPDSDGLVIEIGPGTGVLTKYLLERFANFKCIETDREAVDFLNREFENIKDNVILEDFLKADLSKIITARTSIIGNFPYNISSQIFFKVLEFNNEVESVVCMIQKEVAERISSAHGNKQYGILSVLLQTYYDIEYLFTVNENVFIPPPKVKSAVIKLIRNFDKPVPKDIKLHRQIVKSGFNYRRKTLRNSLKPLGLDLSNISDETLGKRAEQLSVGEFLALSDIIGG